MLGNTASSGQEPLAIAVDVYGNVVDYEPVLSAATVGLLGLRAWLNAHKVLPSPAADLSLWRDGYTAIGAARAHMESDFRQMGDGLDAWLAANKKCIEKAHESAQSGLSAKAGDEQAGESLLVASAQLCQKVLRYGELGHSRAQQIRADLDALDQMSRRIQGIEYQIEDHMRPAEVVQVLLRIECARLDEVARAPLEALGVEIARTCEKMKRTMESEFRLVEQTHQAVVSMIEHVRNMESNQQKAALRRQELSLEMEELGKEAIEQAERDQFVTVVSKSLEQAGAKLIGAMQFQDIVGQRWEHVEHGFAAISAGDPKAAETGFQAMVQHAQLVEANAEMAQAFCRIDECLEASRQAEQDLGEQIRATIGDTNRQAMNVRMHALLFEVWDMVRANEAELREVDDLLSPLVAVAGKLGRQIGDVSHEMRMIALNGQVQAARFGSSTGLEVLAESLRQIADLVAASGNDLDEDSRQIERIATDLRHCFEELHEQAMTSCGECDVDFPPVIEQLTIQEDKCNRALRQALEGLVEMEQVREQMRRSLESAVEPLEGLSELAKNCGEIVEKNFRRDARILAFMKEQTFEAESSRYTMVSEKQVLMQVVGNAGVDEAVREPSAEAKPVTGELDLF